MRWVGKTLGYRRHEDWYRLTWQQLIAHHGSHVLSLFGNSPLALLREYYPDYEWQEWRFPRPPLRAFWTAATNRRRYLKWLGEQLGYHTPADWQQINAATLRQHHGTGLLRHAGLPLASVVADYLAARHHPAA